jgi:hypothetical protein
MEAMLRISLCSYLYLKRAKTVFSHYLLGFLFNKIKEQEGSVGGGERWPKQYIHM